MVWPWLAVAGAGGLATLLGQDFITGGGDGSSGGSNLSPMVIAVGAVLGLGIRSKNDG